MVLPLIIAGVEAAEALAGSAAAAEGIGAAASAGATAARALPMASKFGDLFNVGNVAATAVGLADDIPAITSMILHHGSQSQESPEIQADREQQIVASRDKLVAKLVGQGIPPEQATKQVNDALMPALQQAQAAQQGDGQDGTGGGAGAVIGAGLMAGLPALGAARGGMRLAKAAYTAGSAAPSFLGKTGQVARGLMAGQGQLMKTGVMGLPNPNKVPGASSPWMATGASSPMIGSSSPRPGAYSPRPGAMSYMPGASSPMQGASSPMPGSASQLDPQALAAMARLRPKQPMAPPNAGGMREMTSDPGNRDFQMGQRLLPFNPPQADEAMMIRLALQKLAPQGVEIE